MRSTVLALVMGIALLGMGVNVAAAAVRSMTILIKDHRFEPSEFKIPAHTKIKLIVKNLDATPEEFESHDLNREKIIGGGREAVIFIGPLKPGVYRFFGEFNEDTAQGRIVVE